MAGQQNTPGNGGGEDGPLTALTARTIGVEQAVTRLQGRLEAVEEVAADAQERLTDTPAGGPWCWRYLDPYETAALLTEVRDWVDWAVVRYHVGSIIRPCWHLHGAALEELTGLYVSWRATYQDKPRAYSDDLTGWHDRWFWPCVHRIEREHMMPECTPVAHVQQEDRTVVTDPGQFDAHLQKVTAGTQPGADAETVHAAIDAGRAVPLNPADPTTPVKWDGVWWAILAGSPDGRWVPRPPRVAAALDELLAKQQHANRRGGER